MLLLAWCLGMTGCGSDSLIERRNHHLERLATGQPIKLAVVWSHLYGDSYVQGVRMAIDEINAAGGVAGHKVEPVVIDRFTNLEEARRAVYPLSEDLSVAFALGFYTSEIAGPLVPLMQYYGVPTLVNANADHVLRDRWTGGLFCGAATTSYIGNIIFQECMKQKAQSVVLCYSGSNYSTSIAAALITLLRDTTNLEVQIYRIELMTSEWESKLKETTSTAKFRNQKAAAIFLMDDLESIEWLASVLIQEGQIDMIFTTDTGFDEVLHKVEDVAQLLKIPVFIAADMIRSVLQQKLTQTAEDSMIQRYWREKGAFPNEMVISGYEQAMVVCSAMREAGSAAPAKTIPVMQAINYQGLIQNYAFLASGELNHPVFYMVTLQDGRITTSMR